MNDAIQSVLLRLENSVNDADFLEVAATATDELLQMRDAIDAVEPILRLIERNESVDFGAPEPLVHFVERFQGYEHQLLTSIRRRPTSHSLWMLNRLINGTPRPTKDDLIAELVRAAARDDVDDEFTRQDAQQFLDFQRKNSP